MHCPSCGRDANLEQQFCRNCGMNLSEVGKLVAQHSGSPLEIETKAERRERDREIVRCMFNWIMRGMIVLGIGIVMLVCAKNLELGKLFRMISTFVALSGAGMTFYGVLNGMRQGASLPSATPRRHFSAPINTNELSSAPNPPSFPSVTERTTQLIQIDSDSKAN